MLLQERTSTLSRHKYKSHTHTYMRVFWRAFPCASCFQNHQTSPHLLGLPKSPKSHNRSTTMQINVFGSENPAKISQKVKTDQTTKKINVFDPENDTASQYRSCSLPNTNHIHIKGRRKTYYPVLLFCVRILYALHLHGNNYSTLLC